MTPEMVPLGELMPPRKVSVDPRKTPNREFELYSIPAYDAGAPEVITGRDIGSSKLVIEPGDVLLSRIVPHIRRAWIVQPTSGRPPIGSSEWIVFRSPKFDPAYLRHVLLSDRFHQGFMQTVAGVGGSLLRARPQHVANIEIPLPPIEEQRRIAAVLDPADSLRAKRLQALAKLDILTQAIFLEMFGHPRSNGSWFERAPLGDLVTNEDSIRVPVKLSDREEMDGDYPYYGASGIIDYVDDYLFEGRRLLVAEDGANLLARSSPVAFLADGKYWVNNHAHVLADSGRANLVYLRQAIELLDLSPFVTGSAQPKLNRSKLDSILIAVPSRALQDEFESRVARLQSIEATGRSHLVELDSLFASLQQRAFRGEL